jgi:ribosomal protein S18 acetylase RimI-like enzyme
MKFVLLPCILLRSVAGMSTVVPKSTQQILQQAHSQEHSLRSTPATTFTRSSAKTDNDASCTGNQSIMDPISIRTTQTNDLPTIIDLLSFETNESSSYPNLSNWNTNINRLKTKSSLSSQLNHRLAAVQAYAKVKSSVMDLEMDEAMHDISLCILWKQDPFREYVKKAVKTTLEYRTVQKTPWDEWNFASTPENFMFFHIMMTAVDEEFQSSDFDREPVGFCEVIMVRHPNCKGNDEFIPCITNLVVSPNQRRRGIGKRLIDCAIRSVRIYGRQLDDNGSDDFHLKSVGLYVDRDNESAIALYHRIGFRATRSCNVINERIFMEIGLETDEDGGKCVSDDITNE